MTISVVIATFNRGTLLAECLAHLARQPFAAGDEVIVVDNGSIDETPRVIEAARTRFTVPLHHLCEPAPGKSRAVARAVTVASGDVLAFTDDDVNVDARWLDAMRAAMRDEDVALAGGPVAPRWETPPPRWLQRSAPAFAESFGASVVARCASEGGSFSGERYGRLASPLALLHYGPAPLDLGPRTVLGANMAVRRSAFVQVGGFAPHLGKLRGTLLSGEDRELCRLVQAAGMRAVYAPDALVHHFVPAGRMRLSYYLSWFFWSGITVATLDREQGAGARALFGLPLYSIKRASLGLVRAAGAALRGNVAAVVDNALDVAFAAGYARHIWRTRRVFISPSRRSSHMIAASEGGSGGGR
jgi:glucosyl-dolichyl phosphate glucuronosyltransferase